MIGPRLPETGPTSAPVAVEIVSQTAQESQTAAIPPSTTRSPAAVRENRVKDPGNDAATPPRSFGLSPEAIPQSSSPVSATPGTPATPTEVASPDEADDPSAASSPARANLLNEADRSNDVSASTKAASPASATYSAAPPESGAPGSAPGSTESVITAEHIGKPSPQSTAARSKAIRPRVARLQTSRSHAARSSSGLMTLEQPPPSPEEPPPATATSSDSTHYAAAFADPDGSQVLSGEDQERVTEDSRTISLLAPLQAVSTNPMDLIALIAEIGKRIQLTSQHLEAIYKLLTTPLDLPGDQGIGLSGTSDNSASGEAGGESELRDDEVFSKVNWSLLLDILEILQKSGVLNDLLHRFLPSTDKEKQAN